MKLERKRYRKVRDRKCKRGKDTEMALAVVNHKSARGAVPKERKAREKRGRDTDMQTDIRK